jgi:carboxyl-terminal processing protease
MAGKERIGMTRSTRALLVFFFVFGIGASGLLIGTMSSESILAFAGERYKNLQIFTKVLNLVQQYYVEDVDTNKLVYGGIKGMLGELDPHTNFLPPEVFKEFEDETSGEFGGLGIEITLRGGVLTVISPIEDTPAWKAGIKAGDKIVEINRESTKGLSLVEAAQKMKGKTGTPIILGIFREGLEKPLQIKVVRGKVKIRSVKYINMRNGYAYIKVTSFIEKTARDLERIIEKHEKKNKALRGLILDLRNCPGGLLDQAVKMSDMFLDKGTIVSTVGRNEKDKEVLYAKKDGTRLDFPIIILINEYSASASEIVAGALQDNRRAAVMGQKSFGKGSVQSVVKLGDGSGLKLTVARYFTPKGVSIQAEGITPDILVEKVDPEAFEKAIIKQSVKREKDLKGHLKSDKEKAQKETPESFWAQLSAKPEKNLTKGEKLLRKDFQVLQAFNYLKAWRLFKDFKKDMPKTTK